MEAKGLIMTTDNGGRFANDGIRLWQHLTKTLVTIKCLQ
jgi:hypothetical protein